MTIYPKTIILLALCITLPLQAQKKPKKELYVPMDYSTCGYKASEMTIPDVPEATTVTWQPGDCSSLIQAAIDKVATLPANINGHRGTIVIGEGTFRLDHPLRITTSGIVIRGMGKDNTTLMKHGADRGALIYIEGEKASTIKTTKSDTLYISCQEKVPAGSTTLTLTTTPSNLRPNDRIHVTRPSTREWIEHLGMDDFGGGLDYTGWKPTDIDITWDRTITHIDGNTIHIDAPITTTISADFGGAYVLKHNPTMELTECGVEDLTLASATNDWNPKDEDHCWDGITMEEARDCWVRRVNFSHFAGSAVILQKHTSRITVEDCISIDPISETGGWRRNTFHTRGQQTLFQRCVSRQGMHDFSAGYCAAGPNAFVQCEGEQSLSFSGSIGSWACGMLFDIVNIDGHDLCYSNLEQFQMGTGWNTANSMFWQCTASTIYCYSPDSDNRNSAHGSWGTLTGNGEWTSSNDHVSPRSLYYEQLEKRLQAKGWEMEKVRSHCNQIGQVLPRPTNATSSPTVEQAMQLAQESLHEPRLTLEMWMDSIAARNPISRVPRTDISSKAMKRKAMPQSSPQSPITEDYSISNGHIAHDDMLVTGNQYDIPWWSGRVKDNFVKREARPAITRFVPGREGTGWTDRIDSVVDYLHHGHYAQLDHHYGLWYDLRRTDHERVRRADGDVWAPFYEQPFSRSGKGTAWDGLSCYDLSRPNLWYWKRLNDFASKASRHNILLFNEHYFQHNILEAGAHWVDCPWRPTNNINGTNFPEPVPFAGDKRIFMAEQFYNEQDTTLRPLHKQYIRMCLDQMKGQSNVVHLISAEYTGPTHFTRFWIETIAEWEAETGMHPLVALSCTKDAQDSIMSDPILSQSIDIIDIRYWHYNTDGLWAPEAGRNMAPRQWMRKMKTGKTGFEEVYRAVRECHDLYPDKAITYYAQQYPENGWAVLMAGGSLPNIPIKPEDGKMQQTLLADLCQMHPMDGTGCLVLGHEKTGYLVYTQDSEANITLSAGKYKVYNIDPKTGAITPKKTIPLKGGTCRVTDLCQGKIIWIKNI